MTTGQTITFNEDNFMNFKKTLVSGILCATTLIGVNESANATAYADAVLSLTNMQVTLGNGGGRAAYLSDFNGLAGNNTGSANVTLNGATAGPYTSTTSVQSGLGINLSTVPQLGSGATDPLLPQPVPGAVTNTFSIANASLTGSIIDLTNGSGSPTPAAEAKTGATVSLATNGLGDAHSSLGLSSSFDFLATSALTGGLTLSFDYLAFLAVQLTADQITPAFVNATYKWGVTLLDVSTGNTTVVSSSPSVLNQQNSFDAPFNGTFNTPSPYTGSLSFFSGALTAGDTYKLTINQNSDVVARANSVPEPSSLFLIGLGLLGAAWSMKRKTVDSLAA